MVLSSNIILSTLTKFYHIKFKRNFKENAIIFSFLIAQRSENFSYLYLSKTITEFKEEYYMGSFGGFEVLIVLLVILLFFGAKRIPELARGIGQGITEFRKASDEIKKELEQGQKEGYSPEQKANEQKAPEQKENTEEKKQD